MFRRILLRSIIFAAIVATVWLQLSASTSTKPGTRLREPSSSLTIPTNSFNAVDASVVFHVVFTTSEETVSTLNLRCIESIFYFHPKALVRIHTNSVTGLQKIPDPLQPLLNRGFRIQLTPYTAEDVLQAALDFPESRVNATLARLWADNLDFYRTEKFWFSNESNLLRLCLLYAHGGIYLDTDVVLVSPLVEEFDVAGAPSSGKDGDQQSSRIHRKGLTVDNAMSRDGGSYHCAVMKFTKAGNHFLAAAIDNFFQNYNGIEWGNNGPRVFKRTTLAHPHLVCPSPSSDRSVSETCWLNPLDPTAFQPVPWRQWSDYCFRDDTARMSEKAKRILRADANVFAVHMNNQIIGERLERNLYRKDSICDIVLHNFCVICN